MRPALSGIVAALIFVCLATHPLSATLVVVDSDGNRQAIDDALDLDNSTDDPDGIFQAVQDCLDDIEAYEEKAELISELIDSDNDHVLTEDNASNSATADDWDNATDGTGSGSSVTWGPENDSNLTDGTARVPCASLFHELVHANSIDQGTVDFTEVDTTPDDGDDSNTIIHEELVATRLENWFRYAEGEPQRTQYGDNALPPGHNFAECPDRVCIDVAIASGEPQTLDIEDLYFEQPLEGVADLPGTPIPLPGGAGSIRLTKGLDGQIRVILDCAGLEPVPAQITEIQWKSGDDELGEPLVFEDPPFGCEDPPAQVERGPFDPPEINDDR
jgi:hypothetical protein